VTGETVECEEDMNRFTIIDFNVSVIGPGRITNAGKYRQF